MKKKPISEIYQEIDKKKAKEKSKTYSHHITKLTGEAIPTEYAVCEDGSELPYSKAEEEAVRKSLMVEEK